MIDRDATEDVRQQVDFSVEGGAAHIAVPQFQRIVSGDIITDFVHVLEFFAPAPCLEMGEVAADVFLKSGGIVQLFGIFLEPVIESLLKCQAGNFEPVDDFGKITDDLDGVLPFASDE